jgi:adenosylcobinamide-phosphate synthase
VVGSFEEAIDCWRNYAQRFPNDNDGVILAATSGAVNVRLGGEALKPAFTPNTRRPSAPAAWARAAAGHRQHARPRGRVAHLRSIVGLVWRSVVLWMVLLALLTLARLLG